MTNDELYTKIITSYKGILSNSKIIGNLLSNFVVNNKSIGQGVYNDTSYRSQIDLPTNPSEYQRAMQAIEEDIDDINTLMDKVKLLINNTDSNEEYSYTVSELDSLFEKLKLMK